MIGAGDTWGPRWGCPWHGLIRLGQGLTLPGRTIPAQIVGPNTSVFDAGMPIVPTPPEIASMGGQFWNKAIINWGVSSDYFGYHCRSNYTGIPVQIPGDQWPLRYARVALSASFLSVTLIDPVMNGYTIDVPITMTDIGQGSDQPEAYIAGWAVIGGQTLRSLVRPGTTSIELADFWRNKMLFLVRASGRDLSAPTFYWEGQGSLGRTMDNTNVPFGLIEVELGEPDSEGLPTVTVRVIEDRATALGSPVLNLNQTGDIHVEYGVARYTTTALGTDWQGIDIVRRDYYIERTTTQPGPNDDYARLRTGSRASLMEMSITRGLLSAVYDANGDIRTARYSVRWNESREEDRQHTDVNGYSWINVGPDAGETGATYVHQHYTIDYSLIQELELYGFDGELVDRHEFTDSANVTDTRALTVRAATAADLPETVREGGRTLKFDNDSVDIDIPSYPAGFQPSEIQRMAVPPVFSADALLHWAQGESITNRSVGVRRYSNNLVSLFSASRQSISAPPYWEYEIRYGRLCHPSGTEAAPQPIVTTNYNPMERLQGSYNPITHEVALDDTTSITWV